MGLVVNTNAQSIFAQRALGKNTFNLQRSIEKLSTGFKINRAGDDAAGLSISEKMTAQIKGLAKAEQNTADGVSLIQTAEGGLAIIQDNLQRIRELMVQAANGTNGTDEVNALQREANERISTIEAIAKATTFNGNNLLNGVTADMKLQTGADNGQTTTLLINSDAAGEGIEVDIDATTNGTLGEGAVILAKMRINSTVTITTQDGTTTGGGNNGTLANMDKMLGNVSRMRGYLGALQNSLESKMESLAVARENITASRSRIRDVDVATESSNLTKQQILQQSSAAMLSQANSTPQLALNLLP